MPLKFAYTRLDGGVSIVHAAPKDQLERVLGALSDDDYEKFVRERSIPPDAVNVVKLPSDWQPEERTFRNAWVCDGTSVSVDMPKAREIHLGRIRKVRDKQLAKLDIEYQMAEEKGDVIAKKDIARQKQELRDLPQTLGLDVAVTPMDLKMFWPAGLPKSEEIKE